MNAGPIGVIGCASANALAAEADVVLAVGTRLQDFTTGSWTVFADPTPASSRSTPPASMPRKHRALPVVGDAQVGLDELSAGAGAAGGRRRPGWTQRAAKEYAEWNATSTSAAGPTNAELPTYAHVVGAINRAVRPDATWR